MKFRVGRDALGEAVAWVARALPSRPVVPVLAGLLLEAGDGLVLSCFDYEVSARVRIDADVAEPGTALVPGRLLAEITRSLPSQSAEFTAAPDAVSLTCGSAEFMLVTLPLEEFPALPEPPAAAGTVDGGILAAAAGQVVPAASRDDTLPMLTGVCLDFDGDTITLAATDRYRLAVREIPWAPADPAVRAAALVPARTLADAARTMAAGVPVTIAYGASGPGSQAAGTAGRSATRGSGEPRPAEGMISFEGGGRRMTARLIAGEFIRYRSRFPGEFGCRAEVLAEPFIEAVRRVSLVAERASPVRLAFGPGVVVVEAQAEGRARAVETVPAEFEGDEPVISFNPHYLLDGLNAAAIDAPARSAEAPADGESPRQPGGRIRIEFTSPAKPALITWAADRVPAASERDAGAGVAGQEDPGAVAGERDAGAGVAGQEDPGGVAGERDAGAGVAGQEDPGAVAGEPDAGARNVAAFRYLVVPLRVPARA
jgi:DNA polymerase III subunit beta